MSEKTDEEEPVRFGSEFGPYRSSHSSGVTLSTFKTLVWLSNLGGLLLVVIALEMMIVQQRFYWGLAALIAGVIVALFPSNYEIVGMGKKNEAAENDDSQNSD
ncbi:MAG: hypothetical protein HOE69_06500 [Euryarchaeota archaeon]|jgi:hypothetical protein|nr:hypothetical protein [Euryarchaeota archaeon]